MFRGVILACFALGFWISMAFAHSGGLAGDGCHRDRQAGDRHCHEIGDGGSDDSRRGVSSIDPDQFWVTVVGVVDGRIFVSESNGEIRLSGVDAPEDNQVYGWDSTRMLSDAVLGKVLDCRRRGVDGARVVAVCFRLGRDVAFGLVTGGHIWDYPKESPSYVREQVAARSAGRGLWALPSPCAPWVFRQNLCDEVLADAVVRSEVPSAASGSDLFPVLEPEEDDQQGKSEARMRGGGVGLLSAGFFSGFLFFGEGFDDSGDGFRVGFGVRGDGSRDVEEDDDVCASHCGTPDRHKDWRQETLQFVWYPSFLNSYGYDKERSVRVGLGAAYIHDYYKVTEVVYRYQFLTFYEPETEQHSEDIRSRFAPVLGLSFHEKFETGRGSWIFDVTSDTQVIWWGVGWSFAS